MWPTLINDEPSPRTELLINIDDIGRHASIRVGDYKYIKGDVSDNKDIFWYGDSGRTDEVDYNPNEIMMSKTGRVFTSYITRQQINELNKIRPIPYNQTSTNVVFPVNVLDKDKILQLRQMAEISCNVPVDSVVIEDLNYVFFLMLNNVFICVCLICRISAILLKKLVFTISKRILVR